MRLVDFDVYKDLLKDRCGLILNADQSYILDSRLASISKKWGYSSVDSMTAALHGVPDADLVEDIIEILMTRETSFLRDFWPFQTFSDLVLPYMHKNRNGYKKLKIWCAGVGTGQEAYSLALLIKEKIHQFSGWKIEILATDISNASLEEARQGVYSRFEVQRGLPVRLLLKYFREENGGWQVNADVRRLIKFQNFNLMDNMSALGRFDIISCRNVLKNFDAPTQAKVMDRLSGQLEKDGFLFLGKNEALDHGPFTALAEKRGVYVPALSPHLAIKGKAGLAKGVV